MPHLRASLCSLPYELIEEIIIISTLLGDARAPSTLAQTCRSFRFLVYHQLNRHLWREMFLISFDDPRPACNMHTHGRVPQPELSFSNKTKGKLKYCPANYGFPWEDEYKLRIWAESFILRRTQTPPSGSHDAPSNLPSTNADLYTVLETLLRVVLTAAPLPYHALASVVSHCQAILPHPHPIFSPVLFAAHIQPTLILGSRNTRWLAHVFARGLPPVLMARLTAFDENGEVDIQKDPVKWDGLLAKLVAQVGLMIPINDTACSSGRLDYMEVEHNDANDRHMSPNSGNPDQEEAQGSSSPGDDNSSFESQHESEPLGEGVQVSENNISSDEVLDTTVTSATTSSDEVRRLARIRVYDMSYPNPSRVLGPFLPLETHHEMPMDNFLGLAIAAQPVLPIPDTSTFLGTVAGAVGSDREREREVNNNNGTGGNGNATGNNGGASASAPISSLFAIPVPGLIGARHIDAPSIQRDRLLRFDWAWISAARQVIELNLRDLLRSGRHQGVLRALLSLEGIRSCSAPGFPPTAPEAGEDGQTFEDGDGWDWAGVAGQWRRCVCWMDYRDLICNNAKPLAARFSDPALKEAMRIFPFTLRITHYSRAHASWPGRPNIHFEGEIFQDTTAAATTPDAVFLRMRGTVQMAALGDVRWSFLSFREDRPGLWASEAVQIGGRGSGAGIIGLWTNAEHQPSEPLGPFWAWKVGPANVCPKLAGHEQAPGPSHRARESDEAPRA